MTDELDTRNALVVQDPPVEPDTDLRDFAFMPLDVNRLLKSDFDALADDAEWRAGVTLWCESWHQVPAASLPDNERVLCKLAGLGRDMEAWNRVRDMAMRHFIKCSDGRYYHTVVAEKAREAWEKKQAYEEQLARDRERKSGGKSRKSTRSSDGKSPGSGGNVENSAGKSKNSAGKERNSGGTKTEVGTTDEARKKASGKSAQKTDTNSGSGGNSENSSGKTENSSGIDESSAGIPAENALKGQGHCKREGKNNSAAAVLPASPRDAAAPSPEDQGRLWVEIGNRVLTEAGVDPARWTGNYSLVSAWLTAGYDPDLDIYPTVHRVAARQKPGWAPSSLAYFTRAIEEAWQARMTDIPSELRRGTAAAGPPLTDYERALANWYPEDERAKAEGRTPPPKPSPADFEPRATGTDGK